MVNRPKVEPEKEPSKKVRWRVDTSDHGIFKRATEPTEDSKSVIQSMGVDGVGLIDL